MQQLIGNSFNNIFFFWYGYLLAYADRELSVGNSLLAREPSEDRVTFTMPNFKLASLFMSTSQWRIILDSTVTVVYSSLDGRSPDFVSVAVIKYHQKRNFYREIAHVAHNSL